jgi:hypothetical protein
VSTYTQGYCTYAHTHAHTHTNTTAPSGSPEWLTVGCTHRTSVRLSWGAVPKDQRNGEVTGYSIQVEGPDTTRNIHMTATESYDTCTFRKVCDLRPSTEYSFSVSAVTVAGSGPAISVSFIMPQKG